MWRKLRCRGVRVGEEWVRRLMQRYGIRVRDQRRFRMAITDSDHTSPVAPNLLERNFTVTRPNTPWTGDVT